MRLARDSDTTTDRRPSVNSDTCTDQVAFSPIYCNEVALRPCRASAVWQYHHLSLYHLSFTCAEVPECQVRERERRRSVWRWAWTLGVSSSCLKTSDLKIRYDVDRTRLRSVLGTTFPPPDLCICIEYVGRRPNFAARIVMEHNEHLDHDA